MVLQLITSKNTKFRVFFLSLGYKGIFAGSRRGSLFPACFF
jgi:hypothetical protein